MTHVKTVLFSAAGVLLAFLVILLLSGRHTASTVQVVQVPAAAAITAVPSAPAARQIAGGVWVESGGRAPDAIPSGLTLIKGHPGDPDCFKLPSGGLRCPNHWAVAAAK